MEETILMTENNLAELLKVVLANSFAFRIKSQYYHWNVEGADFAQYHTFLGDLYTEVDGAVDQIAEHIRTLDVYVPGSFGRFSELSEIEDEQTIPSAHEMLKRLLTDNDRLINSMIKAHSVAEEQNKLGIINFLEGRIDIHDKHGWMLRSLVKREIK